MAWPSSSSKHWIRSTTSARLLPPSVRARSSWTRHSPPSCSPASWRTHSSSKLTTRELKILSLLSQGYTKPAIANALFIDIKTVEHHLNSMYSKVKADPDYNTKHLRVSAARLYLETMGAFNPTEATPKRVTAH